MIIVVIDYELENYECMILLNGRTMNPLSKKHFKELLLSYNNDEIYFVDVSDKTWDKFRTKNSKRLNLSLDELNELLNKASFLFLIKKNYVESCTYYPKDD